MTIEILIVDDNSNIRDILNELIIDAGYKTRIAANYNQALSEIDKKMPDVAILDVKLDKGDNDGIELLSHIKSKNKDVPNNRKNSIIFNTPGSTARCGACRSHVLRSLCPSAFLSGVPFWTCQTPRHRNRHRNHRIKQNLDTKP